MDGDQHQNLVLLPEPPEPKNWLEKFCGPGVTLAEGLLQFGLAALAGVAAAIYPYWTGLDWAGWQYVVAGFLGLDMVGGVVTNATNSGKRWYHRRSQTKSRHFFFIAIHAAQIALLYGCFAPSLWLQGLLLYVMLLVLATIILCTPLYLQRAVAMSCYILAVMVGIYVLTPIAGLEWFVPVFMLKLLVSHLPYEVSFRMS